MSGKQLLADLLIESLKDVSRVPDNDVAKLMYYLSCVATVINGDEVNFPNKYVLTDYKNYKELTSSGKEKLLLLAIRFNPLVFMEAKVFIVGPDVTPSLQLGYNKFFERTDQRIGFNVNEYMQIEGKSVKVLKIMVFSQNWIEKYYINPFKNLTSAYKRDLYFSKKYRKDDDDDCCCVIF